MGGDQWSCGSRIEGSETRTMGNFLRIEEEMMKNIVGVTRRTREEQSL